MQDWEARLFFCPLFTGQCEDSIRGKRDFLRTRRGEGRRSATAYHPIYSGSVAMRRKGRFAADRAIPHGKWGLLW